MPLAPFLLRLPYQKHFKNSCYVPHSFTSISTQACPLYKQENTVKTDLSSPNILTVMEKYDKNRTGWTARAKHLSFFEHKHVDVAGVISPGGSQTKQSFVVLEAHLILETVTEYYLPIEKVLMHHVPRHGVPLGVVPLRTAVEDVRSP
jgi:hypothetical protein